MCLHVFSVFKIWPVNSSDIGVALLMKLLKNALLKT